MSENQYIFSIEKELKELSKKLNLAAWDLETKGTDTALKKYQQLDLQYKQYFNDPIKYTELKTLENQVTSPLEKRRINVLLRSIRAHLIPDEILKKISEKESELMQKYVSFRPKLDGKELSENQIREILSKEKNVSVRKKVYEVSKQIGALLAPTIKELVKLRNEGAKALGFSNFFQMQLELQEVDENVLVQTFEKLYQDTDSFYQSVLAQMNQKLAKTFSVSEKEIGPWSWSEPFGQEDPIDTQELDQMVQEIDFIETADTFFKTLGFSKASQVIKNSDLYERKGKNQHAFCINIDREEDIRTLNNLKPSIRWLETLLHEVGHAVYEQGFQKEIPWTLKEPPHMITTEAMALICGRQPYLPSFWKNRSVDERLVEKAYQSLKRRQLIFSRWVMVMTFFEKKLYENPDQDLNVLWWDLVQKYQHIHPLEDRSKKSDWAAKYHIGLAPVYYFSYLLGEMFASQIEKKLIEVNGQGLLSSKSASFLNEHLFSPGNQYSWSHLIEKTVGEPLSSKAWIKEFIS